MYNVVQQFEAQGKTLESSVLYQNIVRIDK